LTLTRCSVIACLLLLITATAHRVAAGQDDRALGVWQANPQYNSAGTWTITLTRTAGVLTGTVTQALMPCESGALAIQSGTADGPNVSFSIVTSQGRREEFKGIVEPSGDAIDFVRSVPSREATPEGPGILSSVGNTQFTARRVPRSPLSASAPTGLPARVPGNLWEGRNREKCLAADLTAPPFAPNSQIRLIAEDVEFSPWTLDLTVGPDGRVTGSATQSQVNAKTQRGSLPGPFVLSSGAAWGAAIGFTFKYSNGSVISTQLATDYRGHVTFYGARRGDNDVDFVCSGVPPGGYRLVPGGRGLVLADSSGPVPADSTAHGLLVEGSCRFTAKIVSIITSTSVPPDAIVAPPEEGETVAITSIDDSLASVTTGPAVADTATASPLAIMRYHVGASFHGRLFALASNDKGDRLCQFEVVATPGDHTALWTLRVENAASAAATAAAQAADPRVVDLEAADERATFIADMLQQTLEHPDEAAGSRSQIHDVLAELNSPGGSVVPPGLYSLALVRFDGSAFTVLTFQALAVRAEPH
jgi:hypothetical protein